MREELLKRKMRRNKVTVSNRVEMNIPTTVSNLSRQRNKLNTVLGRALASKEIKLPEVRLPTMFDDEEEENNYFKSDLFTSPKYRVNEKR